MSKQRKRQQKVKNQYEEIDLYQDIGKNDIESTLQSTIQDQVEDVNQPQQIYKNLSFSQQFFGSQQIRITLSPKQLLEEDNFDEKAINKIVIKACKKYNFKEQHKEFFENLKEKCFQFRKMYLDYQRKNSKLNETLKNQKRIIKKQMSQIDKYNQSQQNFQSISKLQKEFNNKNQQIEQLKIQLEKAQIEIDNNILNYQKESEKVQELQTKLLQLQNKNTNQQKEYQQNQESIQSLRNQIRQNTFIQQSQSNHSSQFFHTQLSVQQDNSIDSNQNNYNNQLMKKLHQNEQLLQNLRAKRKRQYNSQANSRANSIESFRKNNTNTNEPYMNYLKPFKKSRNQNHSPSFERINQQNQINSTRTVESIKSN